MTTPVLDDMQFQFGDDGVPLNTDPPGPFIDISKVQGLDSATFRTSSKDTEGRDGRVVEADFESGRTIVIAGTVYGNTYAELEPFVDELKANFAPSKTYKPFYFKPPGVGQRLVYAKCTSGFRSDWDSMRRVAIAAFQVTLDAGDPIIYGADAVDWTSSLFVPPVPGFAFPFGFSFDFGEYTGAGTGSFSVTHNGNREAPFIATFTGDQAVNVGLLNEDLNSRVQTNYTLSLGDVLKIDFQYERVWLNDVPRRGLVDREGWFLLQPNTVNHLRLVATGGTSSVVVSTRDAWR
jgi:hypothetical protein